MHFEMFLGDITTPDLKAVALHWQKACGTRAMPGWHDIKPSCISGQLSMTWVYKYDWDSDTFTGRLAGDRIEQIFGKSFRGRAMKEIYPPADYTRLFERAKRVVCEPAIFRGAGMVFRHVDRIGLGERIMLPLSDNGLRGDGLLGVTAYEAARALPADTRPEEEYWYAL